MQTQTAIRGNGKYAKQGIQTGRANQLTANVETITPALATEYLERNTNNRRVKSKHVAWLADQMKTGEWVLNGAPISFVGHELVDGQHRLLAVVQSGVTIKSLVVRIPTEQGRQVFNTIDTNAVRSTADVLEMSDEKNATILGSLIRALHKMQSGWGGASSSNDYQRSKLTHQRVLRLLNDDFPDARVSATFVASHYKESRSLMRPVSLGVAHYLFCQISEAAATEFFDKLLTGANLAPRNPILVLRNKLISTRQNSAAGNGESARVEIGMIIKAWNLYREGKSCSHIRMSMTEEMPKPI